MLVAGTRHDSFGVEYLVYAGSVPFSLSMAACAVNLFVW